MPTRPLPLVKALAEAHRKKATGVLVAAGKGPGRRMWLRHGDPVFLDSADPADRYTAILTRLGVLTRTEVLLIEEEFTTEGMTEEQAILASDMLRAAEIKEHGRKVFHERLLSAAAATATWTFAETEPPPGTPEYAISALDAIAAAARGYDLDRLKREFPVTDADRYQLEAAELARNRVELTTQEAALAKLLDAGRPWARVVAESGLSPLDAHRALYVLALLGLASYAGTAAAVTVGARLERTAEVIAASSTPSSGLPGFGRADEMKGRGAKEMPDVLDLPPEAEIPAVHQAFLALVGRYDLGHAHQLPEADREAALALLDRATEAYLVMTHPTTRARYFDAAPWDRESVATALANDLTAEKNYVKAGVFLQAGNFLAAEAAMLPALHMDPMDARFHLRMGIAIYQRAKLRGAGPVPTGAARALEKAAALDPKSDEACLYLGHVAATAGDAAKARACYEKALALNPSSKEARAAVMRAENG